MRFKKIISTLLLINFVMPGMSLAQISDIEYDKCGYNSVLAKSYLQLLGDKWGYSYDSLLIDLEAWAENESEYLNIECQEIWTSKTNIDSLKEAIDDAGKKTG